ncbi:hypothetical protein CON36_36015 [Bacillus cereus]|uniref:Uncharacterized protein n=2 Tax=Bacillus cereus group TaxID=86661 RepID=A0A9X6WND0_BACTU|nr:MULTISPECIES: hypothetical protein [Bacillus cereus group]PDZ94026.1 hypothetical protein CON36_36015 [Bacillus cereus]PFJ38800.1 hypothetical protein COJ15_17130 [Bacillus thuringiensis]PGP11911.1 hypothetical protein COA01_34385 [Bacillus cereus]
MKSSKKYTIKKQLEKANKELYQLEHAKKIISTEKCEWKQHGTINSRTLQPSYSNIVIEFADLYYPWYPVLENTTLLYNTFSYLRPYTIKFVHVYGVKKPFQVYLIDPFNNETTSKHFKSLEKATKYIDKLKIKVEKMYQQQIDKIDKFVEVKEKEISVIKKAHIFFKSAF